MSSESMFSFRVDSELKARFSEAARSSDRNGSQLLRDFMRVYVEEQLVRQKVVRAREDIAKGRVFSDSEASAMMQGRRERAAKKVAKSHS